MKFSSLVEPEVVKWTFWWHNGELCYLQYSGTGETLVYHLWGWLYVMGQTDKGSDWLSIG